MFTRSLCLLKWNSAPQQLIVYAKKYEITPMASTVDGGDGKKKLLHMTLAVFSVAGSGNKISSK